VVSFSRFTLNAGRDACAPGSNFSFIDGAGTVCGLRLFTAPLICAMLISTFNPDSSQSGDFQYEVQIHGAEAARRLRRLPRGMHDRFAARD
jgi:hypothetical protein